MAKKTVRPYQKQKRIPKQDQKQFMDSLTQIIKYLEEDEKNHFDASATDDRTGHIYTHICNVKRWLEGCRPSAIVNKCEMETQKKLLLFDSIRQQNNERAWKNKLRRLLK
mgnify:CR=1 FL=1